MTTKDLRIGNLVMDGLRIVQIEWYHLRYNHEAFTPIPLTTEFLIDKGFVNTTGSSRVFFKDNIGYDFGIVHRAIIHASEDDHNAFLLFKHIKYVHQFQNFYFSVKGQEL